ncbi:MAG: cell envelope integrity protein CreD [Chitinophagales bacterium]
MEDQSSPSVLERINTWFRTSVTLKLFIICFLVLIMLIPATMIKGIITERQYLNQQTTNEVSSNWASEQELLGPIITIPFITERTMNGQVQYETEYFHVLPHELKVNGSVNPTELKRGIYKVIVYEAALDISGTFDLAKQMDLNAHGRPDWNNAFMTIGISDMRGIKNQFIINLNDKPHDVVAGTRSNDMAGSGVNLSLEGLSDSTQRQIKFNYKLDLQGSNNLSFIPVGNSTEIELRSAWNDPSFKGTFLPDERTVDEQGFTAKWNILQLNRNYPQVWSGDSYIEQMRDSSFGVDLIQSLDDYQKSMRSVKYAILTIALTFLVFFLVEIMNGKRIHPFQYILVGLALCLFYVLLVSISEQMDFNTAYIISASAIVVMITLYSRSVFATAKLSFILCAVLVALYSFLFVTLQMSDYALLMGSIGLTIMLGLAMFLTRKIDWYNVRKKTVND